MTRNVMRSAGVCVGMLVLAWVCTAQEAEKEKPKATVIDGVKILPDRGGLEIAGKVCQREGILDFLSVRTGGREYESILAMDVKPSALHAALLVMGAHAGPTDAYVEWKRKQDVAEGKPVTDIKAGTKLKLTVIWTTEDGKTREVPATSLLFNRRTKQMEPETNPWVFTGSYFGKTLEDQTIYVADEDGAVVSVKSEPSAVINLAVDAGNPYDSQDEGFIPNKDVVPKAGTAVVLRIQLAEKKEEPKPEKK